MTRFAILLVLAGCGSIEHADGGSEAGTSKPSLDGMPPICTGQHFADLCGSLDRLQIEATRCTFGAPDQCTQTAAREFIATHNFGRCPLVVTDADAAAVQTYAATMADWRSCGFCACDLACDYRDTPFPCVAGSECLPDGFCRQADNPVDASLD